MDIESLQLKDTAASLLRTDSVACFATLLVPAPQTLRPSVPNFRHIWRAVPKKGLLPPTSARANRESVPSSTRDGHGS